MQKEFKQSEEYSLNYNLPSTENLSVCNSLNMACQVKNYFEI
jgi:hypothetical protein